MSGQGLRIPVATYRLQFNAHFRFSDACASIPYLHALGISDIYASPYFKAREGSLHGYDILDQNRLNPEIGSSDDYEAMIAELHRLEMGQILDIVPNHMCIEGENPFWLDLLENGPSSPYARFFDIDWHPVKQELENKILIPILGEQYGTVLENGELRLTFEEGSFFVYYYEHKLPIIPKSYSHVLTLNLAGLEEELFATDLQLQELMSIVTALKHLPPTTEKSPARITERYREKEVVKRRLWTLYLESHAIRRHIDANIAVFNGDRGDPRSFDRLDTLLQEQVYRISHWRVATEEINYRRFFDINSLGAIRVEDGDVFTKTHALIFQLIGSGKVNGLRIDHADGLRNPEAYIKRLQASSFIHIHGDRQGDDAGGTEDAEGLRGRYEQMVAGDPAYKPFYILGEKILLKSEKLPESWPVFGTTGYDFANQVNGLLVDTGQAKTFERIYSRFIQERHDFQTVAYECKKLVMQVAMSSEINTLGHYLNRISEKNRHTRDFTLNSLIKSIVEVIACFPVYRTYINSYEVAERDRLYIESTISRAKRQNPAISALVFDFIRDVLLLRFPPTMNAEFRPVWLDFVKRFQQITGPVMAKGVEDTAFYICNRLLSLNEVGGSPERFGISVEAFHGQNIERSKSRPLAMLASSTHDIKRSEDVRARINVLTEIPELWREGLSRWSRQNRKYKTTIEGKAVPGRNEEYFLYQTLVGTWPFCAPDNEEFAAFRVRIKDYMLKAMREAKVDTSWISPNAPYEEAVHAFVDAILKPSRHNHFFRDFETFQGLTAAGGIFNSLSQTLLKITSPGVPDFYQGNELWDFSLVDPDNRRLVDYGLRRDLLEALQEQEEREGALATARAVVASRRDGHIKMHLSYKALNFRRQERRLFETGRYLPLSLEGGRPEHACAFERGTNGSALVVVVPILCSRLLADEASLPLGEEVWGETRILLPPESAAASYRNIFTDEIITASGGEGRSVLRLAEVLANYPVALLERLPPRLEVLC